MESKDKRHYFDMPDGISFEVPRDYATYCNGPPVQVGNSDCPPAQLAIEDADTEVRFESGGQCVSYDKSVFAGVLLTPEEDFCGALSLHCEPA